MSSPDPPADARIRRAGADDAAALEALFRASVDELAAADYDAEQRAAWTARATAGSFAERLARLETLVADDVRGALGFVAFRADGYLDLLFVAPRAARRGVATALWRAAADRLRALGVGEVTTHASLTARPFFERRGFQVVGEERVELDGAELVRFTMRRALGPPPPPAADR